MKETKGGGGYLYSKRTSEEKRKAQLERKAIYLERSKGSNEQGSKPE